MVDVQANNEEILDFDKEWDYSNPEATEEKFCEFLKKSEDKPTSYVLQLKTQIARTLGLQRKFDEANQLLDEIQDQVQTFPLAHVRYLLERGRTLNSSKSGDRGKEVFLEAYELSAKNIFDNFTVDAAHMLGIIEIPEKQIEWNEKALTIAKESNQPKAQNWQGSLLNNLGWTYHDIGNFEKALKLFEDAYDFRKKQGNQETIMIAKWCIARTHRSLQNYDKALEMQLELRETNEKLGRKDGYVNEELGELYLLKDEKDNSKNQFAKAYELLSQDIWLANNEKERLDRMLELSK